GAYGDAILQVRHGWSPVAGAVGGAVIAGGAGLVVAAGVVRFRPAFVALATWLAAWMFAIAVDAFPAVTGGAAGMVLPRPAVQLTDLGLRVTAGPPAPRSSSSGSRPVAASCRRPPSDGPAVVDRGTGA